MVKMGVQLLDETIKKEGIDMKFRWIPFLVLLSVLLGVVMGIQIHNLDGIFPQKEKQIEKTETKPINDQEQKNKEKQIETTLTKSTNNQEQLKVESKEVFLETSKIKNKLPQTKRSFLSKMGKNIDKGVTYVFSNLINRIN